MDLRQGNLNQHRLPYFSDLEKVQVHLYSSFYMLKPVNQNVRFFVTISKITVRVILDFCNPLYLSWQRMKSKSDTHRSVEKEDLWHGFFCIGCDALESWKPDNCSYSIRHMVLCVWVWTCMCLCVCIAGMSRLFTALRVTCLWSYRTI